jgi:hypothetical protein
VTRAEAAYWFWWGLGAAFLAVCLAVTWWGLFADRTRGRRCPRCWYDMSHTAGLVCPECGRAARDERHLRRRRRRPLPAVLAALAAAVGISWAIEHNRQRGWPSIVPTTLLVATLPVAGGGRGSVVDEIAARAARGMITPKQWESIVARCASGDWRARPVSTRWQDKYGPLLEVAESVAPGEVGVEGVMWGLPVWMTLRSPHPWPAGAPACLELSLRHWWPEGTECRLELVPRGGAEPIVLHRSNGRTPTSYPLLVEIDSAAITRSAVEFDATLQRRRSQGAPWEFVQRQTLSVPIHVDGALDAALRPVRGDALDEAMRSAFARGVIKWSGGPSPLRVYFEPGATALPEFDDTAVGVRVEILFEDRVARRLDVWWEAGLLARSGREWGALVLHEELPLLALADESDGRWRLVVRGGKATRYWDGEITLPLKVEGRRRTAPEKDWTLVSRRRGAE